MNRRLSDLHARIHGRAGNAITWLVIVAACLVIYVRLGVE